MSRIHRENGLDAVGGRRFVPAATILVATLFMTLPLPLAWGVMPQFGLLLLIVWGSIQPRLVPAWAALLLGLATDVLLGLPFGVWTLLYPATLAAVRLSEPQLEGRRTLAIDWWLAAVLVFVAHLLAWQILAFAGRAPALLPLLAQALVTILAYPVAAMIAARVQNRLIGAGA